MGTCLWIWIILFTYRANKKDKKDKKDQKLSEKAIFRVVLTHGSTNVYPVP